MKKQIRQYAPDGQTTSGGPIAKPEVSGNSSKGSDQYNEVGNAGDSDEDESGVSRRRKDDGTLTGTDKDKTGPDENMATES